MKSEADKIRGWVEARNWANLAEVGVLARIAMVLLNCVENNLKFCDIHKEYHPSKECNLAECHYARKAISQCAALVEGEK